MAYVNAELSKARLRADAFKREQVSAERAATTAKERARNAKRALKEAKKASKEARKEARKARRTAAAAGKALTKALARVKKFEGGVDKNHVEKKSTPTPVTSVAKSAATNARPQKAAAKRKEIAAVKASPTKVTRPRSTRIAPASRAAARPRRIASPAAPAPAADASAEADMFVLPDTDRP